MNLSATCTCQFKYIGVKTILSNLYLIQITLHTSHSTGRLRQGFTSCVCLCSKKEGTSAFAAVSKHPNPLSLNQRVEI